MLHPSDPKASRPWTVKIRAKPNDDYKSPRQAFYADRQALGWPAWLIDEEWQERERRRQAGRADAKKRPAKEPGKKKRR